MMNDNEQEVYTVGSTFESFLKEEGVFEEIQTKVLEKVNAYNGDFESFKKIVEKYEETHEIKFKYRGCEVPISGFLFKFDDDTFSFRERTTYPQSIRRSERQILKKRDFLGLFSLRPLDSPIF